MNVKQKRNAITSARMQEVCDVLRDNSYSFNDEKEFQRGVEIALHSAEIRFRREENLSPDFSRDIVDFYLVDYELALELKTKCSYGKIVRQCQRYLAFDCVRGLILMTASLRLPDLPETLGGKPTRTVHITRM